MRSTLPDFKARARTQQAAAGEAGALRLLDAGRAWNLAPVLQAGGSLIFPHATLAVCGRQIAAAVHACLDCGAPRVLVIGVLHARTPELQEARERVASGRDPAQESAWGLQGPGLPGRDDWREEFSLSHFLFLWEHETRRRGIPGPELRVCYPYLAGGRPDLLPGIDVVREWARGAAVVATTDPVHHGIGYGDPPGEALDPESGGLELARRRITEGLALLRQGDYPGYQRRCIAARSDGRDTGPLLHHLAGPLEPRILDLIADDMTGPYNSPPPTWVACALVELRSAPAS
jgi:hypothetical protein